MQDFKIYLIMLVMVTVLGISSIGLILYMAYSKGKISSLEKQLLRQKKIVNANMWYRRFSENFLTRNEFARIVTKFGALSIYDPQELKVIAVKSYKQSLIWFFSMILLGVVLFRDVFLVLVVYTLAVVVKDAVVDKEIDKKQLLILNALVLTISRLRNLYAKSNSVLDALHECEVPPILSKSIDSIYSLLISSQKEKDLEKFLKATPYRILRTLAITCYQLADLGDDDRTESGLTSFAEAMTMLTFEVNIFKRSLILQKSLFSKLEYLPLATIPIMQGVAYFFKYVVPGTSLIYDGSLGYVAKTLIVLSILAGYKFITTANRAVAIRLDDRSRIILKLLEIKHFRRFIQNIVPKKVEVLYKRNKHMKKCLSSKDLNHIYAEKVVYSTLAVTITVIVLVMSINLGKSFVYNNVKDLSLTSSEKLTKDEISRRTVFDDKFLQLEQLPSESDITRMVKQTFNPKNDFETDNQVTRITKKYKSYHNTYFRWYFILVAYALGAIVWFAPEMMLTYRRYLIRNEEEEDVLQMQTIICVLMNTTLDTLDILYWLYKQSVIYKHNLLEAYLDYRSNPYQAIARARAKAGTSAEFVGLMDKLELTIDEITMQEAFSGLTLEREDILRIRENKSEITLRRRRALASKFSLLSLKLTLFLYVMMPIGIIGGQEFYKAMTSIN